MKKRSKKLLLWQGFGIGLGGLAGALIWLAMPAAPAGPLAIGGDGRVYDAALVQHFQAATPVNPIAPVADAYAYYATRSDRLAPPPAGAVCAVKFLDTARVQYSLGNYASAAAAIADGAHVTHTGRCGTCSTLQDLSVYLQRPDLTAPVRRCGMLASVKPLAMQCLAELGFTSACAETWYQNAKHTGQMCWRICMASWIAGEPSNLPDGRLNTCLACDETQSGPVFKHEAGRTRRNSGLMSSIGRAAEDISSVVHDY